MQGVERARVKPQQVLDMSIIDELLSLSDDGDPELLVDLLHMFLQDAPTKVARIAKGLQAGDLTEVEHASHSLKGSSGNLGATHVQHVCESLQVASRKGEKEKIGPLVEQLLADYSLAEAALRGLLKKYC
jgi:HPt (histidine-containing phosphotransfer) domain-containing protein